MKKLAMILMVVIFCFISIISCSLRYEKGHHHSKDEPPAVYQPGGPR